MRIHTSLSREQVDSCLPSGVYAHISPHGSRKRERAFEVSLFVLELDELHRRRTNSGTYGHEGGNDIAATWDEWGRWMACLYERDPQVIVGWYENYAEFMRITRRERERHEAQYKPTSVAYRTHRAPWLETATR